MQHYPEDDPYEREPLEPSSRNPHGSPSRPPVPPPHSHLEAGYSRQYDRSVRGHGALAMDETGRSTEDYHGPSGYSYESHRPYDSYQNSGRVRGSAAAGGDEMEYVHHPVPMITPGADNFSESASGGMAGIAYSVADRNARESGVHAMHSTGQVPPPPSRAHNPSASRHPYPQYPVGGYQYESGYGYDQNVAEPSSSSSLSAPLGPVSMQHASRSPSRSPRAGAVGTGGIVDHYADDRFQGYSNARSSERHLGVVDPNDIEDDGDDGLYYPKHGQRNSFLSPSNSDRGVKPGFGTAVVGTSAAVGGGGLFTRGHPGGDRDFDHGSVPEKVPGWGNKPEVKSKRRKRLIIILIVLVITGAIIGGVVGGLVTNGSSSGSGNGGESAADDRQRNGDLSIDSDEIQELMDNPDLHRVFPGMDYTPLNAQYPDCVHNEPSQNNITRDVAVLSQLTNKIRLYGTDCNQTQMVIHALERLNLQDEIKIWMGVWQDGNLTTNERQLEQMWDILDDEDYGAKYFEGIIVANEILFREEMTIGNLSNLLDEVREGLDNRTIVLPVATSDLGDDWRPALAESSDYIMANIHPFFAGVDASEAANWTLNFWEENNGQYFKSNDSRNIISETGWPTGGGTHCGQQDECTRGAVAGIDELNQFMSDWVCQALEDNTQYFWFEAFDEPWKERYNDKEKGQEWEDKWGLLDVNRRLKDGVRIPDCGGRRVG